VRIVETTLVETPSTKIMAKIIEKDEGPWRRTIHLKNEIQEFSSLF